MAKKGKYVACPQCGKEFYISRTFFGKRKYCSYSCANEALKKRIVQCCLTCGKDYEVRTSQIKHRGSKYCSRSCQDIGATKRTGEKSHNWKGGITPEAKRIRRSAAWGKWRKAVFERDNHTCQHCGAKSKKGNPVLLHPHHIKQFAYFPELRFEVSNGLTLCVPCHRKVHSKKHETTHQNLS